MWSVGAVIGGVTGPSRPVGIAPLPHFGAIFLLSILTLVMLRTAIMPRDVRSAAQKKEKASIRPDLYIILLGIIAFGSFATEGALYDWSAVYFAQVVQVQESLVRVGLRRLLKRDGGGTSGGRYARQSLQRGSGAANKRGDHSRWADARALIPHAGHGNHRLCLDRVRHGFRRASLFQSGRQVQQDFPAGRHIARRLHRVFRTAGQPSGSGYAVRMADAALGAVSHDSHRREHHFSDGGA